MMSYLKTHQGTTMYLKALHILTCQGTYEGGGGRGGGEGEFMGNGVKSLGSKGNGGTSVEHMQIDTSWCILDALKKCCLEIDNTDDTSNAFLKPGKACNTAVG